MLAAYKKLTGVLSVLLNYGADIDTINKVTSTCRIVRGGWANMFDCVIIGRLDGTNVSL